MEEEIKKDSFQEENPKEEIKRLPRTIWKYIISIFSFSNDKNVNPIEVTENIKKDIEFKGYNVWVLMCSIVIASIGLNVNSIAVVIGAMLISPLMGPIRGIGLSVGTNNFKLLIYSLINFGIATVVSVLVSFLYFKLMPFKDETPEIVARTEPLILDVLIAFFGGLAGIIAASRNDNSTVVPGVAIATALMPPLCVTGYGLATGNTIYFLGAFYLFILNSLFICLATIIVVRYLKFPLATYINKRRERNIKIYIAIFLVVILVPSGMKFMEVFQKSVFTNTAKQFVNDEINDLEGISILDAKYDYNEKRISVFLAGNSFITEGRKKDLIRELTGERYEMKDIELKIFQNDELESNNLTVDDYRMLRKDWEQKIIDRDEKISQLESKKTSLIKTDLNGIEKKLKLITEFNSLNEFSVSEAYNINMQGKMDTTILVVVDWLDSNLNPSRTEKLNQWIEVNFETTNFQVIEKTK